MSHQFRKEGKGFLPAFGTASFSLAIFGLVFSWFAGQAINPVGGQQSGQRGMAWCILPLAAVAIAKILAVVLGILAIFGFGTVAGANRRGLALVGIIIGGLYSIVLATFPSAVIAARDAASQRRSANQVVSTIANEEFRFQLNSPGQEWQFVESESTSLSYRGHYLPLVAFGPDGEGDKELDAFLPIFNALILLPPSASARAAPDATSDADASKPRRSNEQPREELASLTLQRQQVKT
jgi:hypothetical protein